MADDIPPGFQLEPHPQAAAGDIPPGFQLEDAAPSKSMLDRVLTETWPARMVQSAVSSVKAPFEILRGELDPHSEEAAGRIFGLAAMASPMNPAVRAGDRAIAGSVRRGPAIEPGAGPGAAITAQELGESLPVGLASPSSFMQSLTHVARKFPGVGPDIDKQVAAAVGAAGENIGAISAKMTGGAADRAQLGYGIRGLERTGPEQPATGLYGVVERNNQRIDDAFSDLKTNFIDPEKQVTQLPRTQAALDAIKTARAKEVDPNAGLGNYQKLVDEGASFNELQRAKSTLGNAIYGKVRDPNSNPGFEKADMMRVQSALTGDLQDVARAAAKPGVSPEEAAAALQRANKTASPLIQHNTEVDSLLKMPSHEALAGKLINAANNKGGDVAMLARLRARMPTDEFDQVSGGILGELGKTNKGFSLNEFYKNWGTDDVPGRLSQSAKNVLFTKEHQGFLDNIAQMGKHLGDADKYIVTGSASSNLWGAAAGGLAGGLAALFSGNPIPLAGAVGAIGGGYVLAKLLGRPAGAAAIARWARAAARYEKAPGPTTRAALTVAGRDLLSNATSMSRLLQAPAISRAQDDQGDVQGKPPQ